MGATIRFLEYKDRKELEEKILKTKYEFNTERREEVLVHLDENIEELIFDGKRRSVIATVIFP